jgi:delta24(24(1))-sterol reductase
MLPGPTVKGLPLPAHGNIRLHYRCNGIWAWYLTLLIVGAVHFGAYYRLERVPAQFGALLTVAILFANASALILCVVAHLTGTTFRMSGKPIYDFFMGCSLNPRIGRLDLKMWAEIRISWMLLFLLTASAAARQYAEYGTLSTSMLFMLLAHGLYTNACMKGEECIPTTWDVLHEKYGWLLIFWNFAGVPFVYCFNSMYLASRPPLEHSIPYTVVCFALLLGAYYVWDASETAFACKSTAATLHVGPSRNFRGGPSRIRIIWRPRAASVCWWTDGGSMRARFITPPIS